eukprot:UN13687
MCHLSLTAYKFINRSSPNFLLHHRTPSQRER